MIELAVFIMCIASPFMTECFDNDQIVYSSEPAKFFSFPTYIERSEGHYEVWQTTVMPTYYTQKECFNGSLIAVDGCTFIDGSRKIFLTWDSWERLDAFGDSIYWHEIKHAQCVCNWHE